MKRFCKAVISLFLLSVFGFSLFGCRYKGYEGEYPGAYTLICSQVPDTLGARVILQSLYDPQILPLESDSFGRSLYLYLEDTDGLLSLCIVQKENSERVYFYPEKSTISVKMPPHYYDIDNTKLSKKELKSLVSEMFPAESIEKFKIRNDWNKPINDSLLDSAEMISPKLESKWDGRPDTVNLSDETWLFHMLATAEREGHDFSRVEEDDKHFSEAIWMATDDYGRRLYYVEGCYYLDGSEDEPQIRYREKYLEMIAIINPDGSFDPDSFMAELYDKADYQGQISELKEKCGWDQPIE